MERLILILGCWGIKYDKLTLCNGVRNEILDLSNKSERNKNISDYLDSNFRMFDKPLYNNVHTAIWNIQNKFSQIDPIFDNFKQIEEFCIFHSKCGLFLKLEIT